MSQEYLICQHAEANRPPHRGGPHAVSATGSWNRADSGNMDFSPFGKESMATDIALQNKISMEQHSIKNYSSS